jgi:hypothetical protein
VTEFDDLPVPVGADPVDSDDAMTLRAEILRLRESLLAANGRAEVLRDRVEELERTERDLHTANAVLHQELAKNPAVRLAGAIRRRFASPS